MIDLVVRTALRYRAAVLIVAAAIALVGLVAFKNLPIEAYPDVADVSVQVITQWSGHAAEELERQVSLPVELEMNGVPRKVHLRSTSIFGLSVVTLVFEEGTDIYFARQQVNERLGQVVLPAGVQARVGPLASPIGEIFRYTVRGAGHSLAELKELEDWVIERELRSVPGVADVVSFGGPVKQYQVLIKPERLAAHQLDIGAVADALARSNRNAGGGFLEVGSQSVNVRGQGLIQSPDEIATIPVMTADDGTTILIRDIGDVSIGHAPRLGIVGLGTDDDVVQATVLMRKGENAGVVLGRVREKLAEMRVNNVLPDGVTIAPYYDRTKLIETTSKTVLHNMIEGILFVSLVLFLFLGNVRSALIVSVTIPFALLMAFIGMDAIALPANLLSIGAVDFGMVVDGAVVMIENVFSRLAHGKQDENKEDALVVIRRAAQEVARPMTFSVAIITVAYLPIFTLEHVEGKLFRPMAFTVAFALMGSLLFALTAAPALAGYLLRGPLHEFDNPLLRWRTTVYPRVLRWALARRVPVLLAVLALALGGLALAPRVGSEFLPHLDEGAIWARASFPPNISLTGAKALVPQIRAIIREYPEVDTVTSQTGRPDDGTDPTGFYNAEFYVALKAKDLWRPEFKEDKDQLIESIAKRLQQFPGVSFGFSQPISDNVEEATSGVKGQLAVKIYGPRLETLEDLAIAVGKEIQAVSGVADFAVLRELGQTNLAITVDRVRAGQFGVDVDDVEDVIEAGVGGRAVTQVVEGEKRIDLVVRMAEDARDDLDALRRLGVTSKHGRMVPIGQVAELAFVDGANRIYREDNSRYVAVKFGIRGRDLGSAVQEAQGRVMKSVPIPSGYRVVWSGEFESQRRANARLALVVPLTILGIFVLLLVALRSLRDALILLANVLLTSPVGGIVALYMTGTHFSVSAGVGFLALFGTSVQTGVILVSRIQELKRTGIAVDDAIIDAAVERTRPIVMTALVATFGLLPASVSHAIGSDSQRPLAIVVVGGLAGSLLLSLLTLPVLYRTFYAIWPDPPNGRRSELDTMPPPGAIGVLMERIRSLRPPKVPTIAVLFIAGALVAGVAKAEQVAGPEAARIFTRSELVERALRVRKETAVARLAVDAAEADRVTAGHLPNPSLTVQGAELLHGTAVNGLDMMFLQVDQVLPLGGQVQARARTADKAIGMANADVRSVERAVVVEVDEALLALQVADRRVSIHEEAAGELERMAVVVAARSAAGANAVYDQLRVEAGRRKIEADLIDERVARERAFCMLVSKVDPDLIGTSFAVAPLAVEMRPLPELAVLRSLAEERHGGLTVERLRSEFLTAQVDRADRERIPSPDVQLAYQPNFRIPLDPSPGYGTGGYVQLGVSIPLPVWETGSALVRRTELDASMQRLKVERMRQEILVNVVLNRRVVEQRITGWHALASDDTSAIERLRTLASLAYREGTLGALELVDAHQSILDVVLRRVDLDAALVRAWLDLETAVGLELYKR